MNWLSLFFLLFITDICIEASGTNPDLINLFFYKMNICLDVTLSEEGTSQVPGSNRFELAVRAFIGYQGVLLERAIACPIEEREVVPEIIQDVITTNEMLRELVESGLPEVFDLAFYRARR